MGSQEELAILLKSYGGKQVRNDFVEIKNIMKGVDKQINILKGNFMSMSTFSARMTDGISASMNTAKSKLEEMNRIASSNMKKISTGTSFIDPATQKQIQQEMNNLDKVFSAMDEDVIKSQKEFDNMSKSASKNMKKISNAVKEPRKRFAGWALSIMFLGMAMQRVFDQIWKNGSKAFQDVQHSVKGTVTTFDILNSQFDYLKYTLGSAISSVLEPLIPTIIEIVDKFTNWVNNNEELTGGIILFLGLLGGLMTYFGMLKLGLDAIIEALGLAGINFGSLGKIISKFSLAGGILALLGIAAYESDLGELKDYFKNWGTSLFGKDGILSDLFGDFKNVFSSVFDLMKALFGDDDLALENAFKKTIESLSKLIMDFAVFLVWAIENGGKLSIKALLDIFTGPLGEMLAKELLVPFKPFLQMLASLGSSKAQSALDFFDEKIDSAFESARKTVDKWKESEALQFTTYQEVKSDADIQKLYDLVDSIYTEPVTQPIAQNNNPVYSTNNYINISGASMDEIYQQIDLLPNQQQSRA